MENFGKRTVSPAVCVNNTAFFYLAVLHVINLKLLCMTEVLIYVTIIVSHCNSRNIPSFFYFAVVSLLPFVAICFMAEFRIPVAKIKISSLYLKGESENQSIGYFSSCSFVYFLCRCSSNAKLCSAFLLT